MQALRDIMMSKIVDKISFLIVLGVLALALLFAQTRVVVVKSDDFECYFKDKNFELSWIHSVEKEDWIEGYRVEKDGFTLISSKFKTFGAGVPSDGNITKKEEGFVIYDTDIKLHEINWIVSQNVNSTLNINNKSFKVYKHFDEYSELHFLVKKLPFWKLYIKENCHARLHT